MTGPCCVLGQAAGDAPSILDAIRNTQNGSVPVRSAAATTTAGFRYRARSRRLRCGCARHCRGERGKFLRQLRRTAVRALRSLPVGGTDQNLAVLLALLAMKFVNRHDERIATAAANSSRDDYARQRLGVRWLAGNGADTAFLARHHTGCSHDAESGVCPRPSPTALQDAGARTGAVGVTRASEISPAPARRSPRTGRPPT